nr:b3 domain-containing protein [Quercus suber]
MLQHHAIAVADRQRELSNRVYASPEARAEAQEKAEKLEMGLEPVYPTFTKSMLRPHVTGGFWLGLPIQFCFRNLPKCNAVMTLIDEDGDEYPTIYLVHKIGLTGGWKGFAVAHHLLVGDAVVFQLIQPTTFKVIDHLSMEFN